MGQVKHAAECKMAFGRKDPNCPRCRELLKGAAPIKWANARRSEDAQRVFEIRSNGIRLHSTEIESYSFATIPAPAPVAANWEI